MCNSMPNLFTEPHTEKLPSPDGTFLDAQPKYLGLCICIE